MLASLKTSDLWEGGETTRLKEATELVAVAVDNAVLDRGPWDVDELLDMEKCDL
jgi:hypothetical protein